VAMTKPPSSLRWAARIGWLLVVGSILLVGMAGSGSMSETQLVENSLYVVLAFGFGVGMIAGAGKYKDVPAAPQAWMGTLILGASVAAGVAVIRWYILVKFFR
jgi:hypothetical protein